MTPGDLLRQLKKRLPPSVDPTRVYVREASHDHCIPSLWYWPPAAAEPEEVLTWPRGEVPPHSVFTWVCTHPECAQAGAEPFVCRRGDPPQGIERRGLEFLAEPGNCGHKVERRLVARGADAIIAIATNNIRALTNAAPRE